MWHDAILDCLFYGSWGYDRRLDHKSRMRREPPVRFREGLGVQLPRATRLVVLVSGTREQAEQEKADLANYLRSR